MWIARLDFTCRPRSQKCITVPRELALRPTHNHTPSATFAPISLRCVDPDRRVLFHSPERVRVSIPEALRNLFPGVVERGRALVVLRHRHGKFGLARGGCCCFRNWFFRSPKCSTRLCELRFFFVQRFSLSVLTSRGWLTDGAWPTAVGHFRAHSCTAVKDRKDIQKLKENADYEWDFSVGFVSGLTCRCEWPVSITVTSAIRRLLFWERFSVYCAENRRKKLINSYHNKFWNNKRHQQRDRDDWFILLPEQSDSSGGGPSRNEAKCQSGWS